MIRDVVSLLLFTKNENKTRLQHSPPVSSVASAVPGALRAERQNLALRLLGQLQELAQKRAVEYGGRRGRGRAPPASSSAYLFGRTSSPAGDRSAKPPPSSRRNAKPSGGAVAGCASRARAAPAREPASPPPTPPRRRTRHPYPWPRRRTDQTRDARPPRRRASRDPPRTPRETLGSVLVLFRLSQRRFSFFVFSPSPREYPPASPPRQIVDCRAPARPPASRRTGRSAPPDASCSRACGRPRRTRRRAAGRTRGLARRRPPPLGAAGGPPRRRRATRSALSARCGGACPSRRTHRRRCRAQRDPVSRHGNGDRHDAPPLGARARREHSPTIRRSDPAGARARPDPFRPVSWTGGGGRAVLSRFPPTFDPYHRLAGTGTRGPRRARDRPTRGQPRGEPRGATRRRAADPPLVRFVRLGFGAPSRSRSRRDAPSRGLFRRAGRARRGGAHEHESGPAAETHVTAPGTPPSRRARTETCPSAR